MPATLAATIIRALQNPRDIPMTLGLCAAARPQEPRRAGNFGIPGDFIRRCSSRSRKATSSPGHALSHEPALGFAADAAARMHCGLGVMAVTYGAGALNVVNAVASAYAERSPLVILAGCPARSRRIRPGAAPPGAPALISQWRIFSEITCDQVRLSNPRRHPRHCPRCCATAAELPSPC